MVLTLKLRRPRSTVHHILTEKILLQAVCDNKLRFTSAFTDMPGSIHDAMVYRLSPLGIILTEKASYLMLITTS